MYTEDGTTESTFTGWKAFDKADQEFQAWLDLVNKQSNPNSDGGPKGPLFKLIAEARYIMQCIVYRLKTGHSLRSIGHLPPHIRRRETRRLILMSSRYQAANARHTQSSARASFSPLIFVGCALFAFAAFYFTVFAYGLEHPEAKPIDIKPVVGARDTDRPSKPRTKILRTSDESFTITFTQCRENEKEHVSCQMETPDGDSHWVYLPGIHLKASPK